MGGPSSAFMRSLKCFDHRMSTLHESLISCCSVGSYEKVARPISLLAAGMEALPWEAVRSSLKKKLLLPLRGCCSAGWPPSGVGGSKAAACGLVWAAWPGAETGTLGCSELAETSVDPASLLDDADRVGRVGELVALHDTLLPDGRWADRLP